MLISSIIITIWSMLLNIHFWRPLPDSSLRRQLLAGKINFSREQLSPQRIVRQWFIPRWIVHAKNCIRKESSREELSANISLWIAETQYVFISSQLELLWRLELHLDHHLFHFYLSRLLNWTNCIYVFNMKYRESLSLIYIQNIKRMVWCPGEACIHWCVKSKRENLY